MPDLFLSDALPQLKQVEGGYSNDPKDSGGETFCGIARNRHPEWAGWELVDSAKDEEDFPHNALDSEELAEMVTSFYRHEFWEVPGCDDMPPALALEIFDCGVNCGQGTAVKLLQRVLNVMNKSQDLYRDVAVDGAWGPGTRHALEGYLSTRGDMDILLTAYGCLRGAYYIEAAERRQDNETYEFGWFRNRVHVRPS